MDEEFFSVSEINRFIKDVINSGFPQSLWITGEIQGFNRNKSKNHIFFELVEKDPDSKEIVARIGLVIFAKQKFHINNVLAEAQNAFELEDDIEVKFSCKIDFYPPHGALRLIVDDIDPTFTLGKLAQERAKLISKLQKEGIFDKNKSCDFPLVPLNIGLITSDDSAACNDFLSEVKKSGYGFKVIVRNTLMQGAKTEKDVCKAIKDLQKAKGIDVIVITRGGGSIADLSYFDSELIANQIASCRVPILSGIGHEINTTITDLTAHTYAKTPTAVAQLLIHRVGDYNEQLESLFTAISNSALASFNDQKQKLKETALGLQSLTSSFLKAHNEKLIEYRELLKHKPKQIIGDVKQQLIQLKKSLINGANQSIEKEKSIMGHYLKLTNIASPINTIKRGFSITRNSEGKTIKSINELSDDDEVLTEVKDGVVVSKVVHERSKKWQKSNMQKL